MKKQIEQVREFESAFKINTDNQTAYTKFNLLLEELEEYVAAAKNNNDVEIADAITDILYIAFGIVTKHNLDDKMEALFDEVHSSNMSKLGQDGTPIYREDGKVLKGPLYFKPNLKKILDS
jgi:predicted HAD superfamily Cof-like phosphohydrolase